mmetsp:Transcript_9684/g.19766  ORF Transcript_9684/g.19766 Transcript_9684/m.19766 type:complete len:270 (-) Transcript_9684:237-1046(-)
MAIVIRDDEIENIRVLRARMHIAKERDGDLQESELAQCSDVVLVRYLRARQHDLDKAEKMLTKTLLWRREVRPELVRCKACRENPRSHTFRCIGVDLQGRSVFYSSFTGIENRDADATVEHMIECLERVFPPEAPIQTYVWVQDCIGFSMSDMRSGSSLSAMKLFSDHYPERLGALMILDSPMFFSGLWRIVRSLIEVSKVSFVSLDKRERKFEEMFPPTLIARLNKEIEDSRSSQAMKVKEWWNEAPEVPTRVPGRQLQFANAGVSTK